jgi:uncharacterized protein
VITPHNPGVLEQQESLLRRIRTFRSCVVAFSGGVDSSVVAKAARLALGDRAVAVTAVSSSLAAGELDAAVEIAQRIGIQHEVLDTKEFDRPEYVRNAPDRCYHCKTELYTQLESFAALRGVEVILNGANTDDAGDYRPGMQAAREHRVCSPLLECGLNKQAVRALAADWDLPVWNKPASPCLSSRVAYGEEVTPERLAMIDQAEQFLRGAGFQTLRVRYHRGDLARIEVPAQELSRVLAESFRQQVIQRLLQLGFKYVTLDLVGFRSGSMNAVLQADLVTLTLGDTP